MKLIFAIATSLAAGHTLTEGKGRTYLYINDGNGISMGVTMFFPESGPEGHAISEDVREGLIAELTGHLHFITDYKDVLNEKFDMIGHVTYVATHHSVACAFLNNQQYGSLILEPNGGRNWQKISFTALSLPRARHACAMVYKMRQTLLRAKGMDPSLSSVHWRAPADNRAFFSNDLRQGTVEGSSFLTFPTVKIRFSEGLCGDLNTWFFAKSNKWLTVLKAAKFLSQTYACPTVEAFKMIINDAAL